MRTRGRKLLGVGVTGALIALPPPGDEGLGIALGAAISRGRNPMEYNSSDEREKRRSGGGDNGVARWTGIIVIGAIVILAIQVGGLRSFVQH